MQHGFILVHFPLLTGHANAIIEYSACRTEETCHQKQIHRNESTKRMDPRLPGRCYYRNINDVTKLVIPSSHSFLLQWTIIWASKIKTSSVLRVRLSVVNLDAERDQAVILSTRPLLEIVVNGEVIVNTLGKHVEGLGGGGRSILNFSLFQLT